MSKNIYILTLKNIYSILNRSQRKRSIWMILSIVANGAVDVLGLSFILPVLYLALNRSVIYTNPILKYAFDMLGFKTSEPFLVFMAMMLVLVFIVKNMIGLWVTYKQSQFSFQIGSELTASQYKNYLGKEFLYFKHTNSNEVLINITAIPMEFAENILLPAMIISTEVCVLLLISVGIAIYNFNVFVGLILILSPSFILFYLLLRRRIEFLGRRRIELRSQSAKNIFDSIFGYVDVKLSKSENYFIDRGVSSLNVLYKTIIKLRIIETMPIRLIELTAVAGIGLLYTYFLLYAEDSSKLVGFLVLFAAAAYRIMPSLNKILNAIVKIKSASYAVELLQDSDQREREAIMNANVNTEPYDFRESILELD